MKYFMYCRKSTEEEERQALSIDAQISEMGDMAATNGLAVAETFVESKSARNPGRPVFGEMLRRIEEGEAQGIVAWKLDRLARNFDDGGRIIGLLQRGVIKEIRTFEKTYLPSDNVLLIAVELGMANQYVRDLSVNIKRGLREKVRRGIYAWKAPLGYYNHPKLRTIEPEPNVFPKLRALFEEFAEGEMTLTDVQREMKRVGILGERSKKPPPISSIHNVLKNPIYYGVFPYNGVLHEGIHKPLVSKATWDAVQRARVAVAKPRKKFGDKGLHFLGVATCASCGNCITGERHTKKSGLVFRYYRCTHKNKKVGCESRTFVREGAFEDEIVRNIRLVTLPEIWKERFLAKVETWEGEGLATRQATIDRLRGEMTALKGKIERLNSAFTDGSIDLAEFKELKNPLTAKKVETEQRIIDLERSKRGRLEPLKNWIYEAASLEKVTSERKPEEMKEFLKRVGSNRVLRDQTLLVSFLKPWSALAETNSAELADNQLAHASEKWWR